jgi:hypothetical protein
MQRRAIATQNRSSKVNKSRRNSNTTKKRRRYTCYRGHVVLLIAICFSMYCIPVLLFFYHYGARNVQEDSITKEVSVQKVSSVRQDTKKSIIKSSEAVPKSNRTEIEEFYLNMYYKLQKLKDKCNTKTTHTKNLLKDLHDYIHSGHSTVENQCALPPTTSCSKSFSVIIVFHSMDSRIDDGAHHIDLNENTDNPYDMLLSQRLRTLFLNILTLINMPDISPDITVIYHGNIDDLRTDKPYGERIWNWSLKGHHKRIRLVYSKDHVTSSMDDDISDSADIIENELLRDVHFPLHSSIVRQVESDILLFLDGSKSLIHGETGGADTIRAGFDLIRLHSNALVGNEDGVHRFVNENDNWIDMKTDKATSVPICDEPHISVNLPRNLKENTTHRSGAVLNFHGLFLHRSYTCFLWDKPLERFREYMKSISLSSTHSSSNLGLLSLSLSMFVPLSRAHSESMVVYPTLSQTWIQDDPFHLPSRRRLQLIDTKDNVSKYDDASNSYAYFSSRRQRRRTALEADSTEPRKQTPTRHSGNIISNRSSIRRTPGKNIKANSTRHLNQELDLQRNIFHVNHNDSTATLVEMDLMKILQYFGGYYPAVLLLLGKVKTEGGLTWSQEQKNMCP